MRTYKRVFDDKEKLQEMLHLRKNGWSFPLLAKIFNVDHTSILHQCKKYGVEPETKIVPVEEKKEVLSWTEAEKNTAIEMRKNGIFTREIAEKLGRTKNQVDKFFTGIELPATTTYSERQSKVHIHKTQTYIYKPKYNKWSIDFDGTRINNGLPSYKDYLEKVKKHD